jgi:hypothetical protein
MFFEKGENCLSCHFDIYILNFSALKKNFPEQFFPGLALTQSGDLL